MIRTLTFIAATFALTACATSPPRYEAASSSGAGYSEQQIETNRYSVTFRAPGGADANVLQDYALLRAADLTLQSNHDWFWVDHRGLDGEGARHSGASVGIGVGGASFGRHTGFGGGVGFNVPIGGHSGQTATAATLEIRFGEGAKPDDPNAYDARSVDTNVRARLNAR
jgi:hypothetical protein